MSDMNRPMDGGPDAAARTGGGPEAAAYNGRPTAQSARDDRDDRRRAARWKVLYNARVFSGTFVADCVVFDLSGAGAKVRLKDAVYCPAEFKLKFRDKPPRLCRTVWREPLLMGVEFISA